MDCADSGGYNQAVNKNCVSSSTLPSNSRYQHGNDKFFAMQEGSIGNGKETKQASPQESSSPASEPPPILPRRSSSSLKSPNKPAVPPKPRNISNKSTPSPKKSSLEFNRTSFKSSKCNTT